MSISVFLSVVSDEFRARLTRHSVEVKVQDHALGRNTRANDGFMLLEVLVAFVIAALALDVLFNVGLTGLHAAHVASHFEQAVARARSHLAMAVRDTPLIAGDWTGEDGGGFRWHLRVVPVAATSVRPVFAATQHGATVFPLTLYMVSVVISWHDGNRLREVRLDTEQIGQGMR